MSVKHYTIGPETFRRTRSSQGSVTHLSYNYRVYSSCYTLCGTCLTFWEPEDPGGKVTCKKCLSVLKKTQETCEELT